MVFKKTTIFAFLFWKEKSKIMYVFRSVNDLQNYLATERVNKRTLGFIPTMGALHSGHFSLIKHSLEENQLTLCSIFVNPTQFNNPSDLEEYPRTPGKDLEKLALVGCEIAFLPTIEEVYPTGDKLKASFDFKGLDTMMEGAERPGHFAGMAQVVKRFLDIVVPDYLYMGQKDYQQQLIVRQLINGFELPIKMRTIKTIRENDGLAMSSRNVLLPQTIREKADIIFKTLTEAKKRIAKKENPAIIEQWAMRNLTQLNFKPEYFSIVNGKTLQKVIRANEAALLVACTAVKAGDVRLIDNMILKGSM